MKYVFDTNVLIDGFQDEYHAGYRLVEAVIDQELTAVITPRIKKEYQLILRRLIEDEQYVRRIHDFLESLTIVEPAHVDVVIDDRDDLKFLEAAVSAQVDAIVTSDRHLLDVGEVEEIPIITPQEAWTRFEDETGGSSEWQNFVRGLGIG